MSIEIEIIPLIELFLIFAMLGFGWLGYLDLQNKTSWRNQNHKFAFAGELALPGLVLLAILALVLLLIVSFAQF